MNLGPKLSIGKLQAEAKWIWTIPIYQQQIVPAVAINIQNLHCFDSAGNWYLFWFAKQMVGALRKKINVVLRQQHQVGAAIPVEIAMN